MSRALRIEFPGALYHVMSRGLNGRKTFIDDEDHYYFLDRVGHFVKKGALLVHTYALMPNHYHLLCETPEGELSRWMQRILGPYSQRFNRRHDRRGRLWQGRYKAILVQDGLYLLRASRYIHLNPCPSLANQPEEYRWSSFANFVGLPSPVEWVSRSRILTPFQSVDDYRSFVAGGLHLNPEDPFEQSVAGIAYGNDEFVRKALRLVEDLPDNPNVPSLRQLRRSEDRPTASAVERAVDNIFGSYSQCQRRKVLMFALSLHTWHSMTEIAAFAGRHVSSASRAVRSLRQRAVTDKELQSKLKSLEGLLASPPDKRKEDALLPAFF